MMTRKFSNYVFEFIRYFNSAKKKKTEFKSLKQFTNFCRLMFTLYILDCQRLMFTINNAAMGGTLFIEHKIVTSRTIFMIMLVLYIDSLMIKHTEGPGIQKSINKCDHLD